MEPHVHHQTAKEARVRSRSAWARASPEPAPASYVTLVLDHAAPAANRRPPLPRARPTGRERGLYSWMGMVLNGHEFVGRTCGART